MDRHDHGAKWILVAAIGYGALLACLGAAIARWVGLSGWGPEFSSGEILVASIAVAVIGAALLGLIIWMRVRRTGGAGVRLVIPLLVIAAAMLWFVLRFAASWGP